MSAIDQIIEALDEVAEQVTGATTAMWLIMSQVEHVRVKVQAIGVIPVIRSVSALKEELEAILVQFDAVNQAVEEAHRTAKSVAAG